MKTLLFALLLVQFNRPRECPTNSLNINTISKAELITLEGITPEIADTIIKSRPYQSVGAVEKRMPKEVWETNKFKFCYPGGIQIIMRNKTETIHFDSRDVNLATPAEFLSLDPAMTKEIADEIIEGRPYKSLDEVRARIPKEVWEKIQDRLHLRKPVEEKGAEAPTPSPNRPR